MVRKRGLSVKGWDKSVFVCKCACVYERGRDGGEKREESEKDREKERRTEKGRNAVSCNR